MAWVDAIPESHVTGQQEPCSRPFLLGVDSSFMFGASSNLCCHGSDAKTLCVNCGCEQVSIRLTAQTCCACLRRDDCTSRQCGKATNTYPLAWQLFWSTCVFVALFHKLRQFSADIVLPSLRAWEISRFWISNADSVSSNYDASQSVTWRRYWR